MDQKMAVPAPGTADVALRTTGQIMGAVIRRFVRPEIEHDLPSETCLRATVRQRTPAARLLDSQQFSRPPILHQLQDASKSCRRNTP
jgi:hypothetical protein